MASDFRGILALVAGSAGIILLILTIALALSSRSHPSRGRRAAFMAMYGALFFLSGGLLWSRKDGDSGPLATRLTVEDRAPAVASPDIPVTEVAPEQTQALSLLDTDATEKSENQVSQERRHSPASGLPPPLRPSLLTLLRPPQSDGHRIDFPGIAFGRSDAELSGHSKSALRTLARELNGRPELKIDILARVDSLGPEANNFALAQTRASAIRDFLVVQGVTASRLSAQAFAGPLLSDSLIAFVVRP